MKFVVATSFSKIEQLGPIAIAADESGFEALAISDHIEYQPHAKDLPTNHNRPYELCVERARE